MTAFPQSLFDGLVYGAIVLTAGGGITLLALFVRDLKGGSLW